MYSQNSIGNKFKNGDQIGEVLDDIMEDKLSISRLPTIEVMCIDGSYVSCDNRSAWIDIICSFPVHSRNTISYFNKNSNCSS
jgi:antirestriction protein